MLRLRVPFFAMVLAAFAPTLLAQTTDQPFTCIANAGDPLTVRVEGITELVGDVVLNCTGGTPTPPGQPRPTANVTIFLNTAVTSRLLSDGVFNEALLTIDEPAQVKVAPTSPGLALSAPIDVDATYNAFFGISVGPNGVSFNGVPIEGGAKTLLRFTNIRVNASQLAASTGDPKAPVTATVSMTSVINSTSPPTPVQITNPRQTLALVQDGLAFHVANGTVLGACENHTPPDPKSLLGTLRYTENFPTAFKSRSTPVLGTPPLSEGNFDAGLPGVVTNQGTNLQAHFQNVPADVSLYVNALATDPNGGAANLVFPPAPPGATVDTLTQIPVTNGTAVAVWEVQKADPATLQTFSAGVYASYAPLPGNFKGANINVQMGFTNVHDGTQVFPVPAFADSNVRTLVLGGILPCADLPFPDSPPPVSNLFVTQEKNPCYLGPGSRSIFNDPLQNSCSGGSGITFSSTASTITRIQDASVQSSSTNSELRVTQGRLITNYLTALAADGKLSTPDNREIGVTTAEQLGRAVDSGSDASRAGLDLRPKATPGSSEVNLSIVSNANTLLYSTTIPVTVFSPTTPVIIKEDYTDVSDYTGGRASPGQIFSIFPNAYAQPKDFVASTIDANGILATTVADTQVFFGNDPAALLFVTKNQITGIAPKSLEGKTTVPVKVVYKGEASPVINLPLAPSSIAIVSADGSGGGACACLNSDGSFNSPTNRAKPGDVVVLFGNYGGPTDIPRTEGRTTISAPYPKPVGPISATIGGEPVTDFLYYGNLPGYAESAQQWNIRVPPGVKPGPNFLQISAGGATSPPGAYVWIGEQPNH